MYAEAVAQWAAPLAAVMGLMVCADAALVLARPSKLEGKEKQFSNVGDVVRQGAPVQGMATVFSEEEGAGCQDLVVGTGRGHMGVAVGPQAAEPEGFRADSPLCGSSVGTGSGASTIAEMDVRGLHAEDVRVTVISHAETSNVAMR